jgi:hypothetical protein
LRIPRNRSAACPISRYQLPLQVGGGHPRDRSTANWGNYSEKDFGILWNLCPGTTTSGASWGALRHFRLACFLKMLLSSLIISYPLAQTKCPQHNCYCTIP